MGTSRTSRIAGIGLALILLTGSQALAAPGEPRDTTLVCDGVDAVAFEDVQGRYAADLGCLAGLGITRGVAPAMFDPAAPVTRGQAATMLLTAWYLNRIDPIRTMECQGVHGEALGAFIELDMLDDCDGGVELTRTALAQLIASALPPADAEIVDQWPDDDALPDAVQEAHDRLASLGVLVGVPVDGGVELRPDALVSRKEAGLVLLRTHAYLTDHYGGPFD